MATIAGQSGREERDPLLRKGKGPLDCLSRSSKDLFFKTCFATCI